MFHKTCRCGQSSNVFKKDIGPFYIEECCEAKGYDILGNLPPVSVKEIKELNKAVMTLEPVATVNSSELPKSSKEVIKDLVQKTKRKYSRKSKNEPNKGS